MYLDKLNTHAVTVWTRGIESIKHLSGILPLLPISIIFAITMVWSLRYSSNNIKVTQVTHWQRKGCTCIYMLDLVFLVSARLRVKKFKPLMDRLAVIHFKPKFKNSRPKPAESIIQSNVSVKKEYTFGGLVGIKPFWIGSRLTLSRILHSLE